MTFKEFKQQAQELCRAEDQRTGRILNPDTFGYWVRDNSFYLTYFFWKLGLKGNHILFAHFGCDVLALFFVWKLKIFYALLCWFSGYVLDHSDGDLARMRGEANPEWGKIDILLHTWSNMAFWIVLGIIMVDVWWAITLILAFRVILQWHRDQYARPAERYGERSHFWKWAAYPTNVNVMYVLFVVAVLSNAVGLFLMFYLFYYAAITTGQSAVKIITVWKSTGISTNAKQVSAELCGEI